MPIKKINNKKYLGIYLGACNARYPQYNMLYNDIDSDTKPDILADMLDIELLPFDYIVATPPCNYYSKANYRREVSDYSLKTKHLLPTILNKLVNLKKPFVVENVRNKPLFEKAGLFNLPCYVYYIGRHTYWSNIYLNDLEIQLLESIQVKENITHITSSSYCRQGGNNVYQVINYFIHKICSWLTLGESFNETK